MRTTHSLLALLVAALLSGCESSHGTRSWDASVDSLEVISDGVSMQATLYCPAGVRPFATALLLPGGAGAAEVGKAYSHHHSFALTLADHGIAGVVLNYARADRALIDPRRINDIGVVIDDLMNRPCVDRHKLVLVGFSVGGANALMLAGSRTDIAGLVTFFAPVEQPGAQKQPLDYAKTVNCPTLILQGDQDQVTDPGDATKLNQTLQAVGKQAELIMFEGAAHGFTYEGAPVGRCKYDAEATVRALDAVERFISALPGLR